MCAFTPQNTQPGIDVRGHKGDKMTSAISYGSTKAVEGSDSTLQRWHWEKYSMRPEEKGDERDGREEEDRLDVGSNVTELKLIIGV